MTIKTQPKTAFGKTLHYVVDPTQAAALTRLTGFIRLNETNMLYYTATGNGVNPTCVRRISTSQIFVIFYGTRTLNTASLVVNAAL